MQAELCGSQAITSPPVDKFKNELACLDGGISLPSKMRVQSREGIGEELSHHKYASHFSVFKKSLIFSFTNPILHERQFENSRARS